MDNGSGKCKIFLFLAMTFHIYVNWFITDPTFPTFNMGNHSNWWADIPFTKVNYVWFYNDRNKIFSTYWLQTVILPDWTIEKRALSNFPFQHC